MIMTSVNNPIIGPAINISLPVYFAFKIYRSDEGRMSLTEPLNAKAIVAKYYCAL